MISSISKPSLEIRLLGNFRVTVNGAPIDKHLWKRRASAKLVKLLALAPHHRLHREQLIEMLWAHRHSETLSNDLNKAIHAARRVLEPELEKASASSYIKTESQQVILHSPGSLFVDVFEFEKVAAGGIKNEHLADCERALALYGGDLLTEDIYEDWLVSRREHLRLLHRKLVTKTAEIYARRRNYERGIELLTSLSLADPTDERVHQDLMQLYAATGSKYQAIRQFETCRLALAEIGFEPEAKTIEIKERIQAGKFAGRENSSPPFSAAPSAARKPADGTPLFEKVEPRTRNLTYNHGVVQSARFLPGEQDIVFSAAWEENEFELYRINRQSLESVSLEIPGAGVFSVSPRGALALALNRRFVRGYKSSGHLAYLNLSTGELTELLENVQWADWHPEKSRESRARLNESIAVVRKLGGRNQLEFPIGRTMFETGGWLSHPKFSPSGERLAFIYHPTLDDDSGEIVLLGTDGAKRTLSGGWISVQGLAWNKAGTEIWFTATREGNCRGLYAVDLHGNERFLYKATGSLTLHDLTGDGAALVTLNKTQIKIAARTAPDAPERDLTWLDWSLVRDISADGSLILFTEAGESGGALYAAYVRKSDGSKPLRLGEGSALAFSPDLKYALVKLGTSPPRLALYEIASGEKELLAPVESHSIFYQPWACFFPDGRKILFAANEIESGTKLYVQALGGQPVCLTPDTEGYELSTPHAISPDGSAAAIIHPDKRVYLYSFASGAHRPIENLEPNFLPVGWSPDGNSLFVRERGKVPAVVFKFEIESGRREPLFELCPHYRAGVYEILRILVTPDQKSAAYSYTREFSDLIVIEGLNEI